MEDISVPVHPFIFIMPVVMIIIKKIKAARHPDDINPGANLLLYYLSFEPITFARFRYAICWVMDFLLTPEIPSALLLLFP